MKKLKDLFLECNDKRVPEKDFMGQFCNYCKNTSCERAGWGFSSWDERIGTQVERFFHTPTIKQEEASKYSFLTDFDVYREGKIEVWGAVSVEDPKPIITPTQPSFFQKEEKKVEVPIVKDEFSAYNTNIVEFIDESIPVEKSTTTSIKNNDPWAVPPKTLKVGGTFKMS
jgi:hypothetical protein